LKEDKKFKVVFEGTTEEIVKQMEDRLKQYYRFENLQKTYQNLPASVKRNITRSLKSGINFAQLPPRRGAFKS
jgi:hypothetical protein